MERHKFLRELAFGFVTTAILSLFASCKTDDGGPLAPYSAGDRTLSTMYVEDTTFSPRITWLGGYVSVFGVNRGYRAILDTSLLWLVRTQGNNIHYPSTYGRLPQGAADLVSNFGGQTSRLIEDNPYTFWVMKEDVWQTVSANPGKVLVADSTATVPVLVRGDTVLIQALSFTQRTDTIDVYVNIKGADPRGWLINNYIDLSIQETDTSNSATVRWSKKSPSVTDTLMTAMGLVISSGTYSVNNVVWEVLTKDTIGGKPVYRTRNSIASPVLLGKAIPGTAIFTEFPANGLLRNKTYYFWLAQKAWDGVSRDSRVTKYYSWMTFQTW